MNVPSLHLRRPGGPVRSPAALLAHRDSDASHGAARSEDARLWGYSLMSDLVWVRGARQTLADDLPFDEWTDGCANTVTTARTV